MVNNVLVTGGNSFIGIHLVNELIRINASITVLVRSIATVPKEWIGRVKIVEGNITNNNSILNIGNNLDTVFHLAAYVHKIPKSSTEKRYVYAVNVDGTRNLLDSIPNSIKHIVFFSSVSVYGKDAGKNLDEFTATDPVTPYGQSKLEAENIIKRWGQEKNVNTISLRLPLVYGYGNKGNFDKLIRAINKNLFIIIGNGSSKRSMVYVGNVVDAALAVVHRKEVNCKVYIVTDGVDYTVKDMFKLITKGLGKKPSPFYAPIGIAKILAIIGDIGSKMIRKPLPFDSDVLRKLSSSLTFSSRRIQEDIGFKPKYNLYNTIDETIKWYKNRES